MQATLTLISPHGTPVTLTIEPDADTDVITALLDRADAIGQHYAAHGWALAEASPARPARLSWPRVRPLPGIRAAPRPTTTACPPGSSSTASRPSVARSRAMSGIA